MEKSAVEWLVNELDLDMDLDSKWIIEKAKEMERQQIEDAFYQTELDEFGDEVEFEQYYNETFKSE